MQQTLISALNVFKNPCNKLVYNNFLFLFFHFIKFRLKRSGQSSQTITLKLQKKANLFCEFQLFSQKQSTALRASSNRILFDMIHSRLN